MFEGLIAKVAGTWLGNKLNLQEGAMDDTKKWWESKGVWAGVIGIIVVAYNQAIPTFHLPAIPQWILGILSAAGLYARITATAAIEK